MEITTPNVNPLTGPSASKARRKVKAADLLQGAKTVLIDLDGNEYQLQLTRSRKLILTK